ncbi:MAG: carboxypeptidase regulatory-like domain-containing protein [Planctomycetota bacterium]
MRETGPRSGHPGADAPDRNTARRAPREGALHSGRGGLDTSGHSRDRDDTGSLDGIVVDIEGVPVAGATVTYEPYAADEPHAPPRTTVTTDKQGRFTLPVHRFASMMLVARHPDYRLSHDFVDPHDAEPVRVVIEPGAPLTVIVRGPHGVVAGASIEATARARSRQDPGYYYTVDVDDAVTGEGGKANLGRVPDGWIRIRAQKQGLAADWKWFEIPDVSPRTVELKLGRGGTIEGQVTAPDGTPVQGARLHDRGRKEVLATTDAFGRYRITAINKAGIVPVAEADGHGPGFFGDRQGWVKPIRVHAVPNEIVGDVNIVLGPVSRVRGRVIDKRGRPVAGVDVSIEVEKGVVHSDTVITGEDGTFEVGPITARKGTTFSLEFEKRNLTFFTIRGIWNRGLAPGQDADVGDVRASAKAAIAGRVFDVDGSPLKKGYVSTGGTKRAPVRNGVFLVEGVYRRIECEIVAYGFGPARPRSYPERVSPHDGQFAEVELRLVDTLVISGRVVSTAGEPRQSVWLKAIPADSDDLHQLGVTDATGKDGRFELPGLLPGEYRVGIYRSASGDFDFVEDPEPVLVAAGLRNLEFQVPVLGGTLKGKVVAKSSRLPLREFCLTLYERVLFLPKYKDHWCFEDETSTFSIQTSKPGTYFVDVSADNYADHRTKPVDVERGETVNLGTIALGDPGSVHGKVQDHKGQPIAWCRVYLLGSRFESNFDPPFTDAKGRYDVQGLSPGTYTVFAVSPRHPLALRRKIVVREGARVRVNVDVAASAPLILRVVNEQGQPVRGAQLIWTFPDLKPLDSSMVGDREPPGFGSNVSDLNGLIQKPFLPEGDVEVRIEAKGYARARRTITLRAGEKQTVEIRLKGN